MGRGGVGCGGRGGRGAVAVRAGGWVREGGEGKECGGGGIVGVRGEGVYLAVLFDGFWSSKSRAGSKTTSKSLVVWVGGVVVIAVGVEARGPPVLEGEQERV